MAASYPTIAKTFTPIVDGVDYPQATQVQAVYDEVAAIESALLGGLAHPLRFAAAPTLTIAGGIVTVAKGYNAVDTEAAAATDDLDTITPGTNVGEGSVIILRAANVARVVTLKDGTGNLLLNGDYALSATDRTITLVYNGTNWSEVARSVNATAGATVQTITSTGTQNDYAVTAARSLILRCNNATLLTFNGFAAGTDGDIIDIVSVGAGQVDVAHQNAGSSAANRFINFATVGKTSLAAGVGTARFVYDGTTARWRLVHHEQGAWITPTFSAGDYTSDAGTWVVGAGDIINCQYYLRGKELSVVLSCLTTTVTGTPSELRRAIPGGYTADFEVRMGAQISNNGTQNNGWSRVQSGLTYIGAYIDTFGAFTNAADNTRVYYHARFGVQ